jgi:aryl-alcohol dehydrogenase-like predicted oxidoreductase
VPLSPSFYRTAQGLRVSSIGIGSYLGNMDEATDRGYVASVRAAVRGGINFIDTSLNYRHQASERNIGEALSHSDAARADLVVCTKAGYLVPGALPASGVGPADIVARMHCMAPAFLDDQLHRSLANLRLDSIDVFYLHNPETQLSHIPADEFYSRVEAAFTALEEHAAAGRIRYYGAATWSGFRTPEEQGGLSLARMVDIASRVGGPGHRFRFIQLPVNLAMPEGAAAAVEASELGITAVASASTLQTRLASNLPDEVRNKLPGLQTDAQRAIQFARSAPGVTVALVGMSRVEHVEENLRVGEVEPTDVSPWYRQSR